MKKKNRKDEEFQYDVCLSFAGEDRVYVEHVADSLRSKGIRVFYDRYEAVDLWGKDLYSHLDYIYRSAARYCVIFISRSYSRKLWTTRERQSAQARAFSENREYVLPARFDNTEIPGLAPTVGYADLRQLQSSRLARMIVEKLGRRQRINFLPPVPDRLFKKLDVTTSSGKDRVSNIASCFFEAFERMSADERLVVSYAFLHGCPTDLPENVHINIDLLRRVTRFPPAKIKRLFSAVKSLGFSCSLRDDHLHEEGTLGSSTLLVITFAALSSSVEPGDDETNVAVEMVQEAVANLCETCGVKALLNADFSQLASATAETERHSRGKKSVLEAEARRRTHR